MAGGGVKTANEKVVSTQDKSTLLKYIDLKTRSILPSFFFAGQFRIPLSLKIEKFLL